MTAPSKKPKPSPRIHYIFTPNPDISISTAIGTIIACIAAVGFLSAALTALNKFFSPDTGAGPTPETMALCLSLIIGPALVFVAVAYLRDARFDRLTPYRARRLKAIAHHPDAAVRLPHRLVEFVFRGKHPSRPTLEKLLPTIPVDRTIVILPPSARAAFRPTPTPIAFEPIDLSGEEERLRSLLTCNLEQQTGDPFSPEDTRPSTLARAARCLARFFLAYGRVLLMLITFAMIATQRRSLTVLAGTIGIAILVITFGWLKPFFASVRWYLAPGLLMRHEYRASPARA